MRTKEKVILPPHENILSQNYVYPLPERSQYHIPETKKHDSPCMMKYWTDKPIRTGTKNVDTEHDKIDLEDY